MGVSTMQHANDHTVMYALNPNLILETISKEIEYNLRRVAEQGE